MRILVVSPEYPPHSGGGILKYYELMAAAWAAAGSSVCVLVATPYSSFADYERNGVRVRFVPLEHVNRHADRLSHLASAPTYRRWIAAGLAASDWVRSNGDAFDVIETTDFGLLFAPLLCVRDRPPLVVKFHGSLGQISKNEPTTAATDLDFALARLTESAVLPHVDGLQAYSPANANEWQGRLKRSVTLVPAPLPLPQLLQARPSPDFDGLVAGRIQPWKGPEILCRAFRALGRRAPDLKVAWVGRDTWAGPEGQSMSGWLANTYPDVWGDRIIPLGSKSGLEVAQLQASVRFVVVPSTWDTFNYTLPEAMSHGCVTLGSTGAGSSYLIEHGSSGFTFAPEAPEALATLLLEAHSLGARRRQEIGAAARAAVAKALDPSGCAATSLAAFASLDSSRIRPDSWIEAFFEPRAERAVDHGHLENVSIRDLTAHLGTRVARRLVG